MREIKFRAWHREKKCWHYFYLHDLICGRATDGGEFAYESWGEFVGLLDRNGTEIFEGDIVEKNDGRRCEVYRFTSRVFCGWDLKAINDSGVAPDKRFLWEGWKVIGNAYENPELIK